MDSNDILPRIISRLNEIDMVSYHSLFFLSFLYFNYMFQKLSLIMEMFTGLRDRSITQHNETQALKIPSLNIHSQVSDHSAPSISGDQQFVSTMMTAAHFAALLQNLNTTCVSSIRESNFSKKLCFIVSSTFFYILEPTAVFTEKNFFTIIIFININANRNNGNYCCYTLLKFFYE
jgi:hypothetical protein